MNAQRMTDGEGFLLVANYSNKTGYAWNNIYRLFERIALESDAQGLTPWLSFAEFDPPLEWKHAAVFKGVLELPPVPRRPRELWAWIKAIRGHGIRHLYLTDQASWSYRYLVFRLAGIRSIIVHSRVSVPDPRPALPERGIRGGLKWIGCRVPFMHATRVYAVSDFVRDRLVVKARMPEHRVITILNGVDLARFSPCSARPRDGQLVIFCAGRATAHKGIDVLIHATARLRDELSVSGFQVLYAGDGPDLRRFKELVASYGLGECFKFLGELSDTRDRVAGADIVVVPSTWGDACPSAISEALACGKPLIATRAGGVPQLVGEDGAAILVEPGDVAGLSAALARLIGDSAEREALALRARRRAEQALDQERYHAEVLAQLSKDVGFESRLHESLPTGH